MFNSSMELTQHECFELPENINPEDVYRLLPHNIDEKYYLGRTDRNLGWITEQEQTILRNSVVGIAGTGGMGGLLASILVRTGVGVVKKFQTSPIFRGRI